MDNLAKIYNRLLALRENLPQEKHVSKIYVDEFHRLLVDLEKVVGLTLNEFRIDDTILEHTTWISSRRGTQGMGERKCERGFLLAKLDAILLQFRPGENKPPMGFNVLKK